MSFTPHQKTEGLSIAKTIASPGYLVIIIGQKSDLFWVCVKGVSILPIRFCGRASFGNYEEELKAVRSCFQMQWNIPSFSATKACLKLKDF